MNLDNTYRNVGRLDHAIKAYGEVVAVSDISFTIKRGSIMGFIGPNGSGKSTSIRLLLGLIKPQSGKVSLFGVDPFVNSQVKKLVGYVPEESVFPKWITAEEYLSTFARYHLQREVAKKRAREVLEEVDLLDVSNKRIRQFSKGMKQRMKIAQAFIHKPALVIGDEIFNGLDPLIRHNMFELIEHYRSEYNTTFFLSSHILFEVEKLTDTIILLYKGRTIAQGSPKKIRDLIQDQPHSIQITTSDNTKLASLLINYKESIDDKTITSIQFQNDTRTNDKQLLVLTHNPRQFYEQLTTLVVENEITIRELRSTDEGLENLFMTLTTG